MRTAFDLSPFRRSTVGFDRLFDLLERGGGQPLNDGYPPFDIEHEDEDRYRITMAVAGFGRDDIEITAQQNQLVVSGRRTDAERDDDGRFIHRGIAARSFERRFALGDFVKVKKADMRDGLLTIELEREVPDEMKPHRIDIGGGSDEAPQLTERKAA